MSDDDVKLEQVEMNVDEVLEELPVATNGDGEDADDKKVPPSAAAKKGGSRQNLRAAAAAAAAASKTKRTPKAAAGTDGQRKKKKSPVTHPRTLDMVVEAIQELRDTKGSSVQAIRTWILANYKTVRADMIKVMLKRALPQGLDQGLLVRPKNQTETQAMSGRYRVSTGGDRSASPEEKKTKIQPPRAKPKAVETKQVSIKAKTKAKKKSASKYRQVVAPAASAKVVAAASKKSAASSPKSKRKVVAAVHVSPVKGAPAKRSHKKKDKKKVLASPSKSHKKKSPAKKKGSKK